MLMFHQANIFVVWSRYESKAACTTFVLSLSVVQGINPLKMSQDLRKVVVTETSSSV